MNENTATPTSTFQRKIVKKTYIVSVKQSPTAKRTADDAFKALCKEEIEAATSLAA